MKVRPAGLEGPRISLGAAFVVSLIFKNEMVPCANPACMESATLAVTCGFEYALVCEAHLAKGIHALISLEAAKNEDQRKNGPYPLPGDRNVSEP